MTTFLIVLAVVTVIVMWGIGMIALLEIWINRPSPIAGIAAAATLVIGMSILIWSGISASDGPTTCVEIEEKLR
jgi:hypothetical protein